MHKSLSILVLLIIHFSVSGQYNLFLNVKKIFEDGNYEKCLKKSDALLKKEANKKEPVLYLYKSMSLFKISQNEDYNSKYPKALKGALKAANKARVKDQKERLIPKYHSYIERLQSTTHKTAFHQFEEEGEYSLAKSYYNELVDLCDDTLALYMSGKCDLLNEREVEGYKSIDNVIRANYNYYQKTKVTSSTSYVMHAFYDMANYLLEKAVIDSAYKTIVKAVDIFHKEDSIRKLYYEILKNYKTYYSHYNQPELMLRKIIKAGNQYPDDKNIIELEEELIIDLTLDMVSKGQFKYLEKLNSQYTNRKRNGNLKIKLSKTNFNLIKILTDLHHQESFEVCTKLILSIKRINDNINNSLKDSRDSLLYPKGYDIISFINDIMNDLNYKNEFYRSLIFYKYANLFSDADDTAKKQQETKALETSTQQSLNKYINKLFTSRKNLMSGKITGKRRQQEFIYMINGYLQIFDFNEIYPVLKQSIKEFSNSKALSDLFRETVMEDYKLNYNGSQLHIRNKDDKWYSDLDWKGNAKNCKLGDISSLAYDKAEQRINFFRRLSGSNKKLKIDRKNNELAIKLALQNHPEVKKNCDSTKYDIKNRHYISDKSIVNGITSGIKQLDTEKNALSGFELLLDPNRKKLVCASTDKTSVFMENNGEALSDDNKTGQPVCWPPEGYIPSKLVYNYWAFSIENIDLSKAIVKMECMGKEITVDEVIKPTKIKGRNTLLWKPLGIIKFAEIDLPYKVSIYNTFPEVETKPVKFVYTVNIIQP